MLGGGDVGHPGMWEPPERQAPLRALAPLASHEKLFKAVETSLGAHGGAGERLVLRNQVWTMHRLDCVAGR